MQFNRLFFKSIGSNGGFRPFLRSVETENGESEV